jgi:hypothetical protein
LQFFVAQQFNCQHCCSHEATIRPWWQLAALAPMFAAVMALALPVRLDRHASDAHPADDPARHEVLTTLAARYSPTMGGLELLDGHERLVVAR